MKIGVLSIDRPLNQVMGKTTIDTDRNSDPFGGTCFTFIHLYTSLIFILSKENSHGTGTHLFAKEKGLPVANHGRIPSFYRNPPSRCRGRPHRLPAVAPPGTSSVRMLKAGGVRQTAILGVLFSNSSQNRAPGAKRTNTQFRATVQVSKIEGC